MYAYFRLHEDPQGQTPGASPELVHTRMQARNSTRPRAQRTRYALRHRPHGPIGCWVLRQNALETLSAMLWSLLPQSCTGPQQHTPLVASDVTSRCHHACESTGARSSHTLPVAHRRGGQESPAPGLHGYRTIEYRISSLYGRTHQLGCPRALLTCPSTYQSFGLEAKRDTALVTRTGGHHTYNAGLNAAAPQMLACRQSVENNPPPG